MKPWRCSPSKLIVTAQRALDEYGLHRLFSLQVIKKPVQSHLDYRYEIIYRFMALDQDDTLTLYVDMRNKEKLPSLKALFPHADWAERQLCMSEPDISWIKRPEPLFEKNLFTMPEMRRNPNLSEKPFPEELLDYQILPLSHPWTQGKCEGFLSSEAEKIENCELKWGFYHENLIQKLVGRTIEQSLPLLHQLNPLGIPMIELSWFKNFEEGVGLHLPERAFALRMLFVEWSRVAHHLSTWMDVCRELGEASLWQMLSDLRVKVWRLFEFYSGSRMGEYVFKLGGVRSDLPPGWLHEAQGILSDILHGIHAIDYLILNKGHYRLALKSGAFRADQALDYSWSGPNLRATGINYDLRKNAPYYFYPDIQFDVPIGINGDTFDRLCVILEEIRQSGRIIEQVMSNLPLGAFEMSSEEMGEITVPDEGCFSATEGGNGTLGFSTFFNQDKTLRSVSLVTPSFFHAQGLNHLFKHERLNDFPVILSSLQLHVGEIDQ